MVRRYGRAIALTLLVLATWIGLHRIGWEGFTSAWQQAGHYGVVLGIVFGLATWVLERRLRKALGKKGRRPSRGRTIEVS